jgi:hypothetical protein
MDFIWQQSTIYWRNFEDSAIVSAADILQQWMTTLFVES